MLRDPHSRSNAKGSPQQIQCYGIPPQIQRLPQQDDFRLRMKRLTLTHEPTGPAPPWQKTRRVLSVIQLSEKGMLSSSVSTSRTGTRDSRLSWSSYTTTCLCEGAGLGKAIVARYLPVGEKRMRSKQRPSGSATRDLRIEGEVRYREERSF